jgi:hypothetical protein
MHEDLFESFLLRSESNFVWDGKAHEWWLVGANHTLPQSALDLPTAQSAALAHLNKFPPDKKRSTQAHPGLDAVLSKYQISFHWNDIGKNWFLVYQEKGKYSLKRTTARPAIDRWDAQELAYTYINQELLPTL